MLKNLILFLTMLVLASCNRKPSASENRDSELQELKKQVQQLKEQSANTPIPKADVLEPRLSGTVFYRFDSGGSTVVRAVTVYVLTDTESGYLTFKEDTLDSYMITHAMILLSAYRALKSGESDFFGELNQMLRKIKSYANRAVVKTTTDVNGRYTIRNLPNGSYHVVALLETNEAKGFWYVPVEVTQTGPVVLDLNNMNIKVCDVTAPPR